MGSWNGKLGILILRYRDILISGAKIMKWEDFIGPYLKYFVLKVEIYVLGGFEECATNHQMC